MNPIKVNRARLYRLTDLPNVGASIAEDLQRIGITHPDQLCGQSAVDLYEQLCAVDQCRHDPCLLDVFISITDLWTARRLNHGGTTPPSEKPCPSHNCLCSD